MATEGTAAWYREEVVILRDLAAKATTEEAHAELTRFATAFDRLATHAEQQDVKE